jgi:magnesium-transporting ATPase (P-type)
MLIAAIQLLFNSACACSGCSLLDTFALTTFNLLYTSAAGFALVLDEDHPRSMLLAKPSLYRESQAAKWITGHTIIGWAARAALQAAALYCIPAAAAAGSGDAARGDSADQSALGYSVFSSAVLLQMLTVVAEMRSPTLLNHIINAASFAVYIGLFAVRNVWPASSSSLGTGTAIMESGAMWSAGGLAVLISFVPWVLPRVWQLAAPAVSSAFRSPKSSGSGSTARRSDIGALPPLPPNPSRQALQASKEREAAAAATQSVQVAAALPIGGGSLKGVLASSTLSSNFLGLPVPARVRQD